MIVRCTRKLLRGLSIPDEDLESEHSAGGIFQDWHANLLRIDRRKCLLLTDSRTLFVFLVPGILRRDLLPFRDLLWAHCSETLRSHGIDPENVPALASREAVRFAKTNDRRVLGSMNDYAFQFKTYIDHEGGLGHCHIPALNHLMNETPMGMLKYHSAIQAVRSEFGQLGI